MFQGNITCIATIDSISVKDNLTVLQIHELNNGRETSSLSTGDTLLLNGQLARVSRVSDSISLEISRETFGQSNLDALKTGDKVNVELSSGLLGGSKRQQLQLHTVRGRADAVCRVTAVDRLEGVVLVISLVVEEEKKKVEVVGKKEGSKKARHGKHNKEHTQQEDEDEEEEEEPDNFDPSQDLHRGSPITLDGVLLNVLASDTDRGTFSVAVDPQTANSTTLGFFTRGDKVNLEVDAVSRLVRHEVDKASSGAASASASVSASKEKEKDKIKSDNKGTSMFEKVTKGSIKGAEGAVEGVAAAVIVKVVKKLVKDELTGLLRGKL